MTHVEIAGRSVRLQTNQVVGQGGEAVIYRLAPDTALKLYKMPQDPAYAMDLWQQQVAGVRLAEHQRKLPAFPKGLPAEVVTPTDLAYRGKQIVGYTMPYVDGMSTLMDLGNRAWRESSGVDANQVIGVLRRLHDVVSSLHEKAVVIGDFNDLNVLTDGQAVRLVDADSMQFGSFVCRAYTARFLDPLLASATQLTPERPHNELSDWYAYFVMLIQSLLYVSPYGGVHRPKVGKRLQFDERVLKRLTFLSPDVIYPKPALPISMLPDDLQAYFTQVTEHDKRGVFPAKLLDNVRFTRCISCGLSHARPVCPQCQAPGVVRQTMTVRGRVTARRVFVTKGRMLQASVQNGTVRYLYEEAGVLYREEAAASCRPH